jgi:hypothetical protein
MLEKALRKLELEKIQQGAPENAVREMVRLWCQVDEAAPVLVLTDGKNCAGAYGAMHDYASKHKQGNTAYVGPDKAMAIIMEYFGAGTQDEVHSRLEAGLMYRIMQKQMEQWSPYPPYEPTANPQPAAKLTVAPASEAPRTIQAPAFDLSALSLEDEL